jgi:glycosyltransferase involved in cell wall biosynthesis
MNDSGLVDVVIPVFNGEKTIAKAIDSVLNQDSKFINNIIVVDDGSTDSTATIIKNLSIENLLLISTKNNGVSSARNLGISNSNALWIAFLDSDDSWEADKIKRQLQVANNYNLNFICGAVNGLQNYESQLIDAAILMRGNIIATSTVLVKRDIILKNLPLFKSGMSFAEDYLAWLKCLTSITGYYIGEILATYTFDPLQKPKYKWKKIFKNLIYLNIEYLKYLRNEKINLSKKISLQFFLFFGTLKSLFSIYKRFL